MHLGCLQRNHTLTLFYVTVRGRFVLRSQRFSGRSFNLDSHSALDTDLVPNSSPDLNLDLHI